MPNDNPFFLSKVECPICKTLNEFETIKVGAFVENQRDTDFCPIEVTWKFPRYRGYNPLVFFTATCSNCFYTREFTNKYKEWKNDNQFRTYRLQAVKAKHLDQLATADSVIRLMGEAIDLSRYPNESAILKLHLAIFDERLADHPDDLDLGRCYLRIGWVFRSLDKNENPNTQYLKGLMLELDKKFASMKNNHGNYISDIDEFMSHFNSHFANDKIPTDIQAQMLTYKEKMGEEASKVTEYFERTRTQFDSLAEVINEYKVVTLGGDGKTGSGTQVGDAPSLVDFLLGVRAAWSGAVVNETEALEKAIYHYKQALENGRSIAKGNQQIQATYLIAELSRRIGDYDGAKQYFNSTIKYGQEFIYQNRRDQSRTALARKLLELAIEQGKLNLAASKVS